MFFFGITFGLYQLGTMQLASISSMINQTSYILVQKTYVASYMTPRSI